MLLGAVVVVAVIGCAAVLLGPGDFLRPGTPGLSWRAALAAILGGGDDVARTIVWQARLPRVLLAALVGAALAQAGALLQLLLRNPLADPYVLGVSSGAALAAVVGLAAGVSFAGGGHPVAAAGGALGAALVVHRLARGGDGRLATERLVLAGVVLSYLLSAGVMWIVALAPAQQGQQYLFWLMGSLASASGADVLLAAVALVFASVAALPALAPLNLLALGEEHAADSGVAVGRLQLGVFVVAAVLTGTSVAVAGSIGFVGLVVPHSVRLLVGADARLSVPLSAVAGAGFLILADLASRVLGEVPVGVVTATCGAPFFLVLLARRRAT